MELKPRDDREVKVMKIGAKAAMSRHFTLFGHLQQQLCDSVPSLDTDSILLLKSCLVIIDYDVVRDYICRIYRV